MKLQELEAVLALCKSAPYIGSIDVAEKLLTRLSPYLTASYAQTLAPSPSLRTFEPAPYEVLTYNLTCAVLALGLRHDQLRTQAAAALGSYLSGWVAAAAELSEEQFVDDGADDYAADGELARVMTHNLSLLGFLPISGMHTRNSSLFKMCEQH
jgi:phosphatidylinositol 4-kinase